MKKNILLLAILPFSLGSFFAPVEQSSTAPLSQRELSLENRHEIPFVNQVFKDNILLNLAYLRETVSGGVNWDEVTKPFQYEFSLDPQKTFAFHDDIEEKYKETLTKTTNAHFNSEEGFKNSGFLFGDGVCHLASLIYWVALDAGLLAEAPTNHDFRVIPDIPKEYGVSIFSNPYSVGSHAKQNLYITNNKDKPINFKFEYRDNKIRVTVSQNP